MNDQPRQYASATAFRAGLESRLKVISQNEGIDLQRLRRQVSFDRLLARIFSDRSTPWLLKGGYAMELRVRSARTTKDIDLSLPADAVSKLKGRVLELLQIRASTDLGDFFTFSIGQPLMELEAAPEGGARYPVTASLAGRLFTKFHLDVGLGDALIPPTETVEGRDWLGFANITPIKFIAISKEQQFAEKFHAYTLPRGDRPNSRVKDLVDMALLIQMDTMNKAKLKEAIQTTFEQRNTHPVPTQLAEPPSSWEVPYRALATECKLDMSLAQSFELIRNFINY